MVEANTNPSEEEAKALLEASNASATEAGEGEQPAKKKKKRNKKKKAAAEGDDLGLDAPEEEKKAEAGEESKVAGEAADGEAPAKKKRNKKKKNKGGAEFAPREQDNSIMRLLGSWGPGEWKQTIDYSIPVSQQYPDGNFPTGQIMEHPGDFNNHRTTSAELRAKEQLFESDYKLLRRAAEVHRQTRKYAQSYIRPGMKIMDITNKIEETNRRLIEASGLDAGIAFPTGASLNHVAAHWTPNMGDETILQHDDVMKIDYGSHIDGLMTDCAFTVAFNPRYDPLLEAVKEATDTGIRMAGIDAQFSEIGAAIQETMESFECTIGNKTHQVKPIENLCGHSMERYKIHAGKSVNIVRNNQSTRMVEGEQYAIETFGSIAGKGHVYEDLDCSHYMKDFDKGDVPIRDSKARGLLNVINREYGTLAWCRKWLEEHFPRHIMPLKRLVEAGVINAYPPLSDIQGSYTAQYEHTILLRPTCKEVITRGEDY